MDFLLLELFEAAAGIAGIGIEFEGFFVVANGGVGHVFVLALADHDGVFGGKAFQEFVLGVELGLQGLDL